MAGSPDDHDVETGWLGGEADGEEEPLFADDITDDEQDPPPLPPPMPSLGELSANRQKGTSTGGGSGSGISPGTQRDGAGGGGDPGGGANDQEPPQKKRKPLLTLKIDRIFSEKGLSYVEKEFPKLKFRGKGHEASDLKYLMQQYEHWANMLYPKLTFKDLTDRVEVLASKKEFKSQLLLMRRRAARGGRATPPLRLDDSEDEGEGRSGTREHPAGTQAGHKNMVPGDDGREEEGSSGRERSGSGSDDDIHNSETVIVGGASSENKDIVGGARKCSENEDAVGGVSRSSNSALNRLTMDAYGSSDED